MTAATKTVPKSASKKTATKKKSATKKKATKKKAAKKKATKKKAAKKKATKKKAAKKKATKKKATKKKATKKKAAPALRLTVRAAPGKSAAEGKQLVIVESPAKARTINRYLGDDFVVRASVGHVRDLPSRSPRGVKQPIPGVDVERGFRPTYEILRDKTKTVSELKRDARGALEVWFATDLDREGEAIAWHLAEVLGIDPTKAKRVVFNAITKDAIGRAFNSPRAIDLTRVNAQQARRILDRIVGYQASPLLWKKVARGLSAGRVQSVAVRIIVERERAIEAFIPDESWAVDVRLTTGSTDGLEASWAEFMSDIDERGKAPTIKRQNAWMAESGAFKADLAKIDGERFKLGAPAPAEGDEPVDLSGQVTKVAQACGLVDVEVVTVEDAEAPGPARFRRTVRGRVADGVTYSVRNIETKTTSKRPPAPFITSTMQIAAANKLGFGASRTMRTAQSLYEGVSLGKQGQVGLITYMRTDSTAISGEAMDRVRGYIESEFGESYLSGKPMSYTSSNKSAQEAHECVRPTDPARHPDEVRKMLKGPRAEDQYKLYKLIWSRFVACQMAPARWNQRTLWMERSDEKTGAVLKTSGRSLAFHGFYKASGVPVSEEQTLPELVEGTPAGAFAVEPRQKFTNPPPRFSEASLVKALEGEGIGRPSTYASIIRVIQDRNYVEQRERRFYATDLGEVVTDKLVEAFPRLMSVGYTREMEVALDKIEDQQVDWIEMLDEFYGRFSTALEAAHEDLVHAKAEIQDAIYQCPECGARTCYRFGRNGRFLSCTQYPECSYSAPIDRRGRPMLPERVDIVTPDDGSGMEVRTGRFGRFLASINYPESKFALNLDKKGNIKYPAIPPLLVEAVSCPKCDSAMNLRNGKRGPWLGCSTFPKCRGRVGFKTLEDDLRVGLEKALAKHEQANPRPEIRRMDGTIVPDGTPVESLLIEGGVAELAVHPDARVDESA
jgi:DNA topoisomerase-1